MNEPGFPMYPPYPHPHPLPHHLDPTAQEFFPTLPSLPPQIYYTYPPPPAVYNNITYAPPAYVSPAPEPPPPLPICQPPPHTTASSRTLLLSMVPPTVSESTVRRDLEIFGDVRAVQMERRRQGLVTVHFYDVRDAQTALVAIQQQHMQQQFRIGRHYDAVLNGVIPPPPPQPPAAAHGLISGLVVWAQFTTPVTSGLPDGNNQGTLVVFNLDSRVSASYLREIFEAFGPVKELRETPKKRYQRFVEFYDVRNAATAMVEMNGKQIYGKSIVVDFSRPGGQSKNMYKPHHNNNNNHNRPINNFNNHSSRSFERCLPQPSTPVQRPLIRKISGPSNPQRSGGSRSNSSSTGSSSFRESLTNLSISGGCDQECSSRNFKKSGSKKTWGSGGGSGNSRSGGGVKPWKCGGGGGGGRHGKDEYDPRFLIKEDAIMESNDHRDNRTTVMIKNIPNKYSQKLLLNMLDNHCIHCNEQIADDGDDQPLSSYDFVYLPIDFINKCNVGYGFVNMTSPEATLRLYKAFHHQSWEVFNSRKICDVTYARLQGLDALRDHFKNSKFPNDAEEYMPVVFSPPRDGRILSDPMPIIGVSADSSPSTAGNQSEPQIEGVDNGQHLNDDEENGDEGCSYSYNETDDRRAQ